MATYPAFATAADLSLLTGLATDKAELIVDLVSASIRHGVGWPVFEHDDTFEVAPERGYSVSKVFLPARHLTSVQVQVGGEALTLDEGYTFSKRSGVVTLARPTTDKIVVNYTAGFPAAEVPEIFRTVALEYAGPFGTNPEGVKQYAMGGTSESLSTALAERASEDSRLARWTVGPAFGSPGPEAG